MAYESGGCGVVDHNIAEFTLRCTLTRKDYHLTLRRAPEQFFGIAFALPLHEHGEALSYITAVIFE